VNIHITNTYNITPFGNTVLNKETQREFKSLNLNMMF